MSESRSSNGRDQAKTLVDVLAASRARIVRLERKGDAEEGLRLRLERYQALVLAIAHVIFLTGGAFTARAREFLGRVPNPRIEKPFAVASVLAVIAALTGARGKSKPGSEGR